MYAIARKNKEKFFEFSYRELSRETGIAIKYWSLWFNGKAAPNFDTLEKIAVDLGLTTLELVEVFMERRSRTIAAKKEALD